MTNIVERLLDAAALPNGLYAEAADTITELADLLIKADKVVVWESHGLGRDFSDKVEAAIAKATPSKGAGV